MRRYVSDDQLSTASRMTYQAFVYDDGDNSVRPGDIALALFLGAVLLIIGFGWVLL